MQYHMSELSTLQFFGKSVQFAKKGDNSENMDLYNAFTKYRTQPNP